MKKSRVQSSFLAELRKVPIVQVACEKLGVSRNSVYRWRKEDDAFAKAMDEALEEGEKLVNDMTESQLLALIGEQHWPAISFWLRHRNAKFRDRIEVTAKVERVDKPLSPEDQELIKSGLLMALPQHTNHEPSPE
ncbi:hypothetical protein KGM48_01450 [Patescibacteria group bacterium]|nr:hypothetical protein [Patescibacteria group bacterium]